jgi:hypothetical protein
MNEQIASNLNYYSVQNSSITYQHFNYTYSVTTPTNYQLSTHTFTSLSCFCIILSHFSSSFSHIYSYFLALLFIFLYPAILLLPMSERTFLNIWYKISFLQIFVASHHNMCFQSSYLLHMGKI